MKTINLFCNSIIILLFTGLSMNTVVAQTTKKENVTKVYSISQSGNIDITSSFGTNIEILTWDRNEVKVVSELTYEDSEKKDDIDKLLNAFKNMSAESSRNVLKLNLILIKSSSQTVRAFGRSENTTILYNDDKTSLNGSTIKTTYMIWIPETLNVKADSKFGKIKMSSIKGNVDFNLSNNNLEMGDFGESGIFHTRFSTITIGNGGASKFDVSNGNVNASGLKNVTIDAKFSNFNIEKAHNVSMIFNNGTAVFGTLNDIDASARFSTIRIEKNAGKSKFDFQNSKLFGKNFQTMEISARFSNFKAASTGNIKINSSNNSNFDFGTVNAIICRESRFSTFELEEIVVEASFPDTHNSDIFVSRTSALFTGFSGKFRFGTVRLKIHPDVAYNLTYNATFGKLHVSPEKFKTKYNVTENPGSKTYIHGINAGAKCNIELVTSNTTCRIE